MKEDRSKPIPEDTRRDKPNRQQRRRANKRKPKPERENTNRKDGTGENVFTGPINDISWYSKYPDLLSAASQAQFVYRPGMLLPLYSGGNAGTVGQRIPGVWAINWVPTIGKAKTPDDPASIVAKEIFARVRSQFSGEITVDAPDFVMYLLALDSIYSYIATLKRIYRVLDAYTPTNYAVPDQLLRAFGLSDTSIQALRSDKVKFFSNINTLIYMVNKFKCPAIMDYFNRHYWMNDNVFMDSSNAEGQFYCFVQKFYLLLDEDGDTTTTPGVPQPMLQATASPVSSGATAQTLFDFGITLINALSNSSEWYTASGYLLKAYEGTPNFTATPLVQDEVLQPIYSEEVLSQIENATTLPSVLDSPATVFSIKQNVSTNALVADLRATTNFSAEEEMDTNKNTDYGSYPSWLFGAPGVSASSKGINALFTAKFNSTLNLHGATPTPAQVVVASRLRSWFENLNVSSDSGDPGYNVFSYDIVCGSECVIDFTLVNFTKVFSEILSGYGVLGTLSNANNVVMKPSSTDVAKPSDFVSLLQLMSQFDWHPFIEVITGNIGIGKTRYVATIGDTDNITVVDANMLKELHKVCLYSEFNTFQQA